MSAPVDSNINVDYPGYGVDGPFPPTLQIGPAVQYFTDIPKISRTNTTDDLLEKQ